MTKVINEKMQAALNGQINAELYSTYLYLSMEAYFQSVNLAGFAKWMKAQTQEEMTHAMKIYDYVNQCGGRVILEMIEKPPSQWESPLAVFEAVYKHEQKVTGLINDLVNLANKEKDPATGNFLQWFVKEQIEEEDSANAVVEKLKSAKDSPDAMSILDNELGKRIFK